MSTTTPDPTASQARSLPCHVFKNDNRYLNLRRECHVIFIKSKRQESVEKLESLELTLSGYLGESALGSDSVVPLDETERRSRRGSFTLRHNCLETLVVNFPLPRKKGF